MIKTFTFAALVGGALMAAPASAAPIGSASGPALALASGGNALVETVQYRRYGYGPRYGYRGGYYRGGRGAAVGAGIAAGVIGGALAAGALAGPRYVEPAPIYVAPAPVYGAPVRAYGYGASDVDAVAYCSRRFRSYDPETGTYIATGGVVRACP
ncbi:MAG: BA14K family protein [Hyphomicrobiales bacterium]|nr:MAG: BA14K family protein [Hyphomicrobiales bacterium]